LLSYKNVDRAIAAWPFVFGDLHIIGDGPERAALERLAEQLEVLVPLDSPPENRGVRFHGQLPDRKQVLAEIASAELLLQPSEREGQSTVVLEALTLGTPVVATVGPETAVGDFLGSGPKADLARIEVSAPEIVWAERIAELLDDPAARSELVAMGQREVAALRWTEEIAPRVERLYESVISAAAR